MDILFQDVAYAATGAPTKRASKDRAADVRNVKDFGAKGDGTTDDRPAIQAAVDSFGVNAGAILFPRGNNFHLGAPISLDTNGDNKSIILLGEGNASQISGNFAGYLIDKASTGIGGTQYLRKISQLYLNNQNTAGGAIRLVGTAIGAVRDCVISAAKGVTADNNSVVDIANCKISGVGASGGYGIAVGGECTVYKCDVTGMGGDAIRASGVSGSIIGCRCEINAGYAINLGTNGAGSNAGASGWSVKGNSLEGNGGGIYCNGVGFSSIRGNTIHGEDGNGSFAGVTIPAGGSCNYTTFSNLACYGDFGTATDPGNTGHSIFIGFGCQGLVFEGVDSYIVTPGHGADWVIHQQDCTQFRSCNQPAPITATYANRPGFDNNVAGVGGPLEGDRHTFTDSATATFGATISGGGSNNVVGRYSSRTGNWTVVAVA